VASGLSELFLAQTDDQDRLVSIQMTASPISATRVRQMVLERLTDRSDPLDIAQLVSPSVARYISDHALYQAALPG
jgi:nicotinic acid mononucleotide adenylyltransferase